MAQQESLNNDSLLSTFSASLPPGIGNHTVDTDDVVKVINLQHLISRGVYIYSVFGLLGLLAGISTLIIYFVSVVKKINLTMLGILVFTVTLADFALVLFSSTDLIRPNPLTTSALCCTILSFSFNIPYFYTALIQVAIFAFKDKLDAVQDGSVLRRCLITTLAVLGVSTACSVLVSTLAGVVQDPGVQVNCYLDPLEAPPSYRIVKFLLGFLVPTLIALFLIVRLFIHSRCSGGCQPPLLLPLAMFIVSFLCRLVYNTMLLLRREAGDSYGRYREEAKAVLGELILFGGSCLCLCLLFIGVCTRTSTVPQGIAI